MKKELKTQLFSIMSDKEVQFLYRMVKPDLPKPGSIVEIDLLQITLDEFIMAPYNGIVPIIYENKVHLVYKGFLKDFWIV